MSDSIDMVRVRVLPDGRMDRENAARYLGRRPKTLAMWAWHGKGPRLIMLRGVTRECIGRIDAFNRSAAMDVCRRHCGSKYQRTALLDVPASAQTGDAWAQRHLGMRPTASGKRTNVGSSMPSADPTTLRRIFFLMRGG